jgi:hypothetical protein
MAKKRKTHDFENCPPAPCLHPVQDCRKETTAKPMCDPSVTSTKSFELLFGGSPMRPGALIFESHTKGGKE